MLEIDRAQAERFLTLLDEEAEGFTFQTFDDNKSGTKNARLSQVLNGSLDEHFDRLSELNQKGAGVFVCINRTDLQGRKKENIVGIRAVWQENDGDGRPLPLEPHIVVESSPGKSHSYVLTDTPSLDFDGHRTAMRCMVEDFGSDPSAVDISRVMRLPGFNHRKDPTLPNLVRIISESGAPPLAWDAIKSAFRPSRTIEITEPQRPTESSNWIDNIRSGTDLHDSTLKLAAFLVSKGLSSSLVKDFVETVMLSIEPSLRDGRWKERYADIPRLVRGAFEKGFQNKNQIKNNFELVHAGELTKEPPALTWLIRDLLLPGSMAMIHGKPAAGKSFIAIDWACSIATGRDWMGKKVKKGFVVYIAGEGHFGISRRLKAWSLHNQISFEGVPMVVSKAGAGLSQQGGCDPVMLEIDAHAAVYGFPELIVVDTLNRNFGGGDENSPQDMGEYIKNLDLLKDKYGSAILTVHHQGHSGLGRARGHSSLFGAMDAEFSVEKPDGGDRILLTNTKMKDGPAPEELILELESVKLPWKDDQSVNETSAVLVRSSQEKIHRHKPMSPGSKQGLQSFLDALIATGCSSSSGLHVDDWRPFFYKISTAERQDAKQRAFQRLRVNLVTEAVLVVEDDVYRIADHRSTQYSDAAGMISAAFISHNAKSGVSGGPPWNPDTGQLPDMSGTCLPAGNEDADRPGHTPMGCPVVRHPCPSERAGKEQVTNAAL